MKMRVLLLLWAPCLLAQDLVIRPAVELEFPAQRGRGYSLESSSDLTGWSPLLTVIVGQGALERRLISTGDSNQFYRWAVREVRDLTPMVESIRHSNRVPALACAVVLSNQIVGLGASGLRKAGISNAPVTLDDRWHHGP